MPSLHNKPTDGQRCPSRAANSYVQNISLSNLSRWRLNEVRWSRRLGLDCFMARSLIYAGLKRHNIFYFAPFVVRNEDRVMLWPYINLSNVLSTGPRIIYSWRLNKSKEKMVFALSSSRPFKCNKDTIRKRKYYKGDWLYAELRVW